MNLGVLKAVAEDIHAPEDRLKGFFAALLHSMLDPSPDGWIVRVIMRETASHTEALPELIEQQIRPTARLFRTIIARLMDLPVDHEAVVRGTISTIAQFIFIFQNRDAIELINPGLNLRGEGIDRMALHIWRFSVGGLRAVAPRYQGIPLTTNAHDTRTRRDAFRATRSISLRDARESISPNDRLVLLTSL